MDPFDDLLDSVFCEDIEELHDYENAKERALKLAAVRKMKTVWSLFDSRTALDPQTSSTDFLIDMPPEGDIVRIAASVFPMV